jgi:uncharacterized protein YdaU (DUF1376 family)
MHKIPMMPTYPDTNLADTASLSLEEKGAFRELLDYMWLHEGWLENNDKRVARMLRISMARWLKLKRVLEKKFFYANGNFTYERLLNDYARAMEKIERNRTNGKLGAMKRVKNINSTQPNAYADARAYGTHSLGELLGHKQ